MRRRARLLTAFAALALAVAPAIAVPADRALAAAQAAAMAAVAAKAPADERREAERLAAFYRATVTPVRAGRPLADYAGTYGDRRLAVSGDRLTTSRGGRAASPLVPVEANVMVPEGDPVSRFRFVEEGGRVVALEVERVDGSVERFARTAGA